MKGRVTIELEDLDRLREAVSQGKKAKLVHRQKVEELKLNAKELSSFFTFMSKKIGKFDDFVSAFNAESQTCEIQKSDDGKYKIKLNLEDEESESNRD